jgi:hypothetical protein
LFNNRPLILINAKNVTSKPKFGHPAQAGVHLEFPSISDGPRSGWQLLLHFHHSHHPWWSQRGDGGILLKEAARTLKRHDQATE